MKKQYKAQENLFKIGEILHIADDQEDESGNLNSILPDKKISRLTKVFKKLPEIKNYKFNNNEILLLGCAWYQLVSQRKQFFDPIELLEKIYGSRAVCIRNLPIITDLLNKNVFFTEKKQMIQKHNESDHLFSSANTQIQYNQYSLLENDVYFHRSFLSLLLNETENISENTDKPYTANREFLKDWFSYVHHLWEFSMYDFTSRRYDSEMDQVASNDLMKTMQWETRIENRLQSTTMDLPLIDIVNEYHLDHNETVILAYLVKEDMEGNNVDTDEVIKLISRDHHEMYLHKQYISPDSKLARNGLIELSENVFFRSKGGELRISPDITRQIIMKTPVSDDERLSQILKGNEIFSLLEPSHTINDLILPDDMKKTIMTSLKRYEKNVDKTISGWKLFEGGTSTVGSTRKTTEPGLLMLFHGLPGTGKTFASAAIAQALGKKLLVTDMSRIQSMWVGESEKNVRRLFTIFERIVRRTDNPPVLLLNEADQFLTRRLSKTGSSVDVMYNTLQNLFLEAFEHLKGVMIATTNIRENLDPAFSRRFNLKLEFPLPEYLEREKLWKLHLPGSIPGAIDIDVKALARSYSFTGGQISIVVKNAATEAAGRKEKLQKLTQADIIKYSEIEMVSMFDRKKIKMGFYI